MKNSYTGFANKYDQSMFDTDYQGWADHIIGILDTNGVPRNAKILETACGTGNISFFLNKAGYKLTATDKSVDMLNIAAEKCRKNGQRINFAVADMTDLDFDSYFDALICCCDGVNYLSPREVGKFLSGAYDSLKPGGILIFDISTENKLKNMFANNIFCDETEDFAYIWKNNFNNGVCHIELTLFSKLENDIFIRADEYHELFAHGDDALLAKISNAGFTDVSCSRGDNTPITEGRTLFIGRRR